MMMSSPEGSIYSVYNSPDRAGVKIGQVNITQTKLTWVIRGFERKACTYKTITSPTFTTIVDGSETNWKFHMSLDCRDEDGEECIGIDIDNLNNYFFRFALEFAILDTSDKEVYKHRISDAISGTESWAIQNFIKKDDLLNVHNSTLINASQLTIICTITTNPYIDVERCKDEEQIEQSLRFEESKNLLNLLSSETFSDVVFSVEGKEIRGHKCILANRSPVFEAMFKHDMKESKKNSVVVRDIPYSAMYDLFKFIYSGTVPVYAAHEQYQNYVNLMIAADKYGIHNLKVECERRLSNNLQVDNVFKSLNLADTHNALQLKESAIDFIASNGDKIIESPTYKEFGKLHPEISCEVFRALVLKKRKIE